MIIEYQFSRGIMNTANVFHTLLPFYATQTINPFLNSRISSNHDKMEEHSPKLYCIVFGADRAEKHDLKSRPWLFFSPFLFSP